MKKVVLLLIAVLVIAAAIFLSSGFSSKTGEENTPAVETENTAAPAVNSDDSDAAAAEAESSPEPVESTLEPTFTPVEEIPEISVSDDYVIVLEENQGTDGV